MDFKADAILAQRLQMEEVDGMTNFYDNFTGYNNVNNNHRYDRHNRARLNNSGRNYRSSFRSARNPDDYQTVRRNSYANNIDFSSSVQNYTNTHERSLDMRVLQSREFDENDYDLLLRLDNNIEASRKVLSDIELSALPSEIFRSPRKNDKNKHTEVICIDCSDRSKEIIYIDCCESPPLKVKASKPSCSVCLDEISGGQLITRLPCLHIYHQDCIFPWLRTHGTCPIDKVHVLDNWSP